MYIVALSPMTRQPRGAGGLYFLPSSSISSVKSSNSSFGGMLPPSYQCIVNAARPPSSGNSNLIFDFAGYVSPSCSGHSASTEIGSRMLSAMNGMLHVWQAMSPSAPVPKSHQPRHANG